MTSQLARADLARMTPQQIEAARKEGRLNDLLGVDPERTRAQSLAADADIVLGRAEVVLLHRHGMHEAINAAADQGRIAYEQEN